MGFGFKQPLVGEKRCVTTLITAAEETTTFCANNRVLFPDHEEKLGFRRLYYCKMGFFLITDNTDKCTIDETSTMLDSVTSANLFFFYPFHSTRRSSFYLYVASSSTTQSTMTVSCKQKF